MKAIKTGMLWIDNKDLDDRLFDNIIHSYTYRHPMEQDDTFSTYVLLKDRIGIPAGDADKVKRIFVDNELTIEDKSVAPVCSNDIHLTGLTLRPYQEEALSETLDYFNDGGTTFNLSGNPGSGKSILISAILSKLNVKTLIIAHLSMLTTQLYNEISTFTDADVKILNADDTELGDVNIATSQFISKHPEIWYKIKKDIGLIIVDEAETIGSLTTLRILQRAHAKYRIAVTATFTRSIDGRTPALIDMIGTKVITLVNDKLLKPTIICVNCDEYFSAPTNKLWYKRALMSFYKKNADSIHYKVITIARASLEKGRQVLIAADVAILQEGIAEELEGLGIPCGIMNKDTKKAQRDQILLDYSAGKIKVLLGFGVLNAGLSIPKITTIIRVATPGNTEKLEQLIGRGRRDFEGKEGMWLFDLMFSGFRYQNSKRLSMYRKKVEEDGWTLSQTSWSNLEKKMQPLDKS